MDWVKGAVLRLARVPDEPQVPDGAADSVRVFRAGRNYLAWRLFLWGLGNAALLAGLGVVVVSAYVSKAPPQVSAVLLYVAAAAAGVLAASLPVTYFLQRLNYEARWYMVTDRSLRIRSGVVWVRETTMTFANIQGIRVEANPIERLLGLANVEVRSAGGGAADPHTGVNTGHVARFEGVDNADAIRDLLVERLRMYRDSGLGEKTEESMEPAAVAAARELLRETRGLREAMVSRA